MANLFIADFIRDPLWDRAGWKAITFGFDPKGVGPPYMGIVFGDASAARELFGKWIARHGNVDRWEAIRIAIIEGDAKRGGEPALTQGGSDHEEPASPPEPRGGSGSYVIHICPDPVSMATDGQALSAILQAPLNSELRLPSRICRADPVGGPSTLLPRFKQEYAKHKEFLLAPVTSRPKKSGEGSDLRVDINLGIIKRQILFRATTDLDPANPLDLDAQALGQSTPHAPTQTP